MAPKKPRTTSKAKTKAKRAPRTPARKKAAASAGTGETAKPPLMTVVYVHGIGNKPIQSVLKCQWDMALFGVDLGDKSRMAYWVDRERYPSPEPGTCASGDRIDTDTGAEGFGVRSAPEVLQEQINVEIEELGGTAEQRRVLRAIAKSMMAGEDRTPGPRVASAEAKVLPLPPFMRRLITRRLTKLLLRDVNDFLFKKAKRQRMEASLRERLVGPGPFVVIAHSQGTMVAYQVLRQMAKADIDVPLFLTIGSPLGLAEVQDVFKKWTGTKRLPVPPCVGHWVNVADRFDPVALDSNLSDDFIPKKAISNHRRFGLNEDSPRHPHSATGYLSTPEVRQAVRARVPADFSTPLSKFVIARDLSQDLEDTVEAQRHDVLIELVSKETKPIDAARDAATKTLVEICGNQVTAAEIEQLRHFISAKLTRAEIETVRARHRALPISRVWRDAQKKALLETSIDTVQARAANLAYRALGGDVNWAVLDTGVAASHPHFGIHSNVAKSWDCTQRGAPTEGGDDGHGHGTHVAGIIAGEHALPDENGKEVTLSGMAAKTRLHIYKVLDDDGRGQDSWIIKAIDHIAETNEAAGSVVIHGVNLSLGGPFDPSVFGAGHSPLCCELRRLWQQGVLVVIAAGNEGYSVLAGVDGDVEANMDLSIADPANLDEAIAVGSVHKARPHTYGVSYFSSRGPTADGRLKPDVVAPGEKIVSASHRISRKAKPTVRDQYVEMSGTSMAAPHVSGMLAAFLSARREFIGYPDRVKSILLENCTDLGRDPYIQGKGLPNLVKMLTNT